ncbi:MAG: helix-turn-helix domain-containing protein [Balneolaceae bacterium]
MASIGKDLATIRLYLDLSLEDIHQATRIPIATLKRIENSSIFSDPDENKIYVRSFVRTYAKALKISEELTLKSLDQYQSGNYNRLLLDAYPDIKKEGLPPHPLLDEPEMPEKPVSGPAPTETAGKEQKPPEQKLTGSGAAGTPESGSSPKQPAEKKQEKQPQATGSSQGRQATEKKQQEQTSGSPPDPQQKTTPEKTREPESNPLNAPPPPRPSSVNWAEMGHQFKPVEKKTPVWLIGIIVVIIILAVSLYIIYKSDLFSENVSESDIVSPPVETESEESGLNLNLADGADGDPEETGGATLEETLYITVYAAHGQLEPVRVWSDLKPRPDPYWIEEGHAVNFEFRDSIRIRGQYNNMLLFMNGRRIDNFRQEHFNTEESSVELTRDHFTEDNRWSRPVSFEVPGDVPEPDSIYNRPTFQ